MGGHGGTGSDVPAGVGAAIRAFDRVALRILRRRDATHPWRLGDGDEHAAGEGAPTLGDADADGAGVDEGRENLG